MRLGRLDAALIDEFTRSGLWSGKLVDLYLDEAAARYPDQTAVVDRERTFTFAQMHAMVGRAAAGLAARGVHQGDVVSFQLPNWAEAVIIHLAVLKAGAISNPIIPIYRQRELRFILRQSRARVIFVPHVFRGFDYAAMLSELRTELPDLTHIFAVGGEAPGLESFAEFMATPWEDGPAGAQVAGLLRGPNDPVLLLYTSGTTADPKGALHTHNTLDYENRSIINLYRLTSDDVIFMPSPVTHITGILYGLLMPPMLGAKVVFQDVWNPTEALALMAEHRCSFFIGATPFLHGLTYHPDLDRYDLASLRVAASGGADVPPELMRETARRFDCCATRVYGSTECPTVTAGSYDDPPEKRACTDGRPIGAARARVVDEDGGDLRPGQVGELIVQGPEMFIGYLDEALNRDAFTADGWFRTGDLAMLDADGYVEIKGRKKDIILRGGENISVKEVEDLLFEHPKVQEVAIVAMPDPVMVERACAFVVPRPGESLNLQDVVAYLKQRQLAMQKLPERLELVPELPKTASGKVQKFKLREIARSFSIKLDR